MRRGVLSRRASLRKVVLSDIDLRNIERCGEHIVFTVAGGESSNRCGRSFFVREPGNVAGSHANRRHRVNSRIDGFGRTQLSVGFDRPVC